VHSTFAIVLDREIQSVPYIDFVRNPDGIPGDSGAQIDMGRGGGLGEAKKLALVCRRVRCRSSSRRPSAPTSPRRSARTR
jgi:hypothetical protein